MHCEISGSHCGNYNDYSLLIALMMEAVRTSEASVFFNEITVRNIPEGCNPHCWYAQRNEMQPVVHKRQL
jgi:hypothetical protein